MKLVYQYMAIFFTFSPTSNHFQPLQVENCDSNSRLVVDEDDNGKFRMERVKNVHFYPAEAVSRYWDPQLQVDENYSHLINHYSAGIDFSRQNLTSIDI